MPLSAFTAYSPPMADSQKLILIVHPTGLQGFIWQTVLRSQGLSVIWESPDVNLIETITQLKEADFALPDLVLIDTRLQNVNPYGFCRWRRKHCPELKVVLVNGAQHGILPSERQWAIYQGALDLLPRFQRENLVSGAAARVRRILELLGIEILDTGALVSVLLTMKQDLKTRDPASPAILSASSSPTFPHKHPTKDNWNPHQTLSSEEPNFFQL
jgi:CheY-like chemotaxis protein